MDGSNPITGRLFQVPPLISSSNSCSAGSSSSNINTAWFQVSFGDTIGTQDHGAKYNRTVLAVFENYFNWSHMSFPLGRVQSSLLLSILWNQNKIQKIFVFKNQPTKIVILLLLEKNKLPVVFPIHSI
jgi:hypothetical protein